MQKILRKRTLRELKKNTLRYFALFLLITLGMYVIISVVAAADSIMIAEENADQKFHAEDGEFNVFVPLNSSETASLTKDGITLEPIFYMDYRAADDSTVRVFRDRDKINQVNLFEGKKAENENELVLERNYARANGLKVGDHLTLVGKDYSITGIATTSDYEQPLKEISDTTVQSNLFGVAFVTEEGYRQLKDTGSSIGSEVYTYAYLRNGSMTDQQLKDCLRSFKADKEEITDTYFKDMIKELEEKKTNMEKGIHSLTEGADELHSGLDTLKDTNKGLKAGAEQIFSMYLRQANKELKAAGIEKHLTEENYSYELQSLSNSKASALLEQLDSLKEYKEGVAAYTKGEREATEGSKELLKGITELEKNTRSILNSTFSIEIDNLTSFIKRADNPRIGGAVDDVRINKYAGVTSGVIVMVLFTFVISVFVIHSIEQENTVIGALYALGVTKRQLLLSYLTLPVIITLAGGIVGTIAGFSPVGVLLQEQDTISYYSVPQIPIVYPVYLLVYGLIMPPVIAAVVNFLVISKKLGEAPLKLLRNEKKQRRTKQLNMKKIPYVRMFQIRQFLREIRSGIAIVAGMLLSLMILMVGINCYAICTNMISENETDTKYAYMYSYKYPTDRVPKGGEACYMETLKKEIFGYNLDVSLLGIDEKNPYFDFQVEKGQNQVAVSQSAATKYGLKAGDKLVLSDEVNERDYAFTINKIVPYSVGLYVFMDLDSMRELFGKEDTYYNVVYADKALKVEQGRLYATTTKEDITKSSKVFLTMMYSMVISMVGIGIGIFVVVMYLMLKVSIDRSASSIALMKVFGYRKKEIRLLYLDGNFYLIAVGGIFAILIAKVVIDKMYPYFISNVACGMNLSLHWWIYLVIYAGILFCYLVIDCLLVRKLKKVVPAEALKNRE